MPRLAKLTIAVRGKSQVFLASLDLKQTSGDGGDNCGLPVSGISDRLSVKPCLNILTEMALL